MFLKEAAKRFVMPGWNAVINVKVFVITLRSLIKIKQDIQILSVQSLVKELNHASTLALISASSAEKHVSLV